MLVASATSDFLGLDPHLSSLPPFNGILVDITTPTASFYIRTSSTCRQMGSIYGVAIVVATPSCVILSGLPRKPHPSPAGPRNRKDRCMRICRLILFLPTLPSGAPRRPRCGQRDSPPASVAADSPRRGRTSPSEPAQHLPPLLDGEQYARPGVQTHAARHIPALPLR